MSTAEQDMSNRIQSVKNEMNKSYENIINEFNVNPKVSKVDKDRVGGVGDDRYGNGGGDRNYDYVDNTYSKKDNNSRTKNNTLNKSED